MGLNKIAKFEKEKKRKKRMEDWVEIHVYTYSETDCGGAGLDKFHCTAHSMAKLY